MLHVIVFNLCFADECAQHDPPIGNIAKFINGLFKLQLR